MKKSCRILKSFLIVNFALIIVIHGCRKEETINPTNGRTTAVFNPDKTYGQMTDQDGNTYKTITIGTQTWMAENLRTVRYRNGDPIPLVTETADWKNLSTGAYCNYQNTKNLDTIATFGRLYNWSAVTDSRQIAPAGWHVPTYQEWMMLESYAGDSVIGDKLKEADTLHWKTPNRYSTNETGFTALGGGQRFTNGDFFYMRLEGGWWTVTEGDSGMDFAYHVTLGYSYRFFGGCNCPKSQGFSVRLVKD